MTSISTVRPMRSALRRRIRSSTPVTGSPSSATTRSSRISPPAAAGPLWSTLGQHRAGRVGDAGGEREAAGQRRGLAGDADEGAADAAMRISSLSTKLAVLLATAKQMPCAPRMMAVLMPITSLCDETSGPPELPGLSAASVWITSSIIRPVTGAERPAERRDDAGGDRRFEAERVADRDDQLAAPQPLGIAERRRRQVARGVGADERQVGVGILADELRVGRAALRVGEADLMGAGDDMAVGEDQPVRREDDAGADAAARLPGILAARVDAHHGRADRVGDAGDGARIGVEERGVVVRGGRGRARLRCRFHRGSVGAGYRAWRNPPFRTVIWGVVDACGRRPMGGCSGPKKVSRPRGGGRLDRT